MLEYFLNPSKADLITSAFDIVFVYSNYLNLVTLMKDKTVKEFDWRNMILYFAWNVWSTCVIYPDAKLYIANLFNVFILLLQLAWIVLYLRYRSLIKND